MDDSYQYEKQKEQVHYYNSLGLDLHYRSADLQIVLPRLERQSLMSCKLMKDGMNLRQLKNKDMDY